MPAALPKGVLIRITENILLTGSMISIWLFLRRTLLLQQVIQLFKTYIVAKTYPLFLLINDE